MAAAAPSGYRWFQLYVYKDRAVTLDLIRRAEKAGYVALAVTVDTPILSVLSHQYNISLDYFFQYDC